MSLESFLRFLHMKSENFLHVFKEQQVVMLNLVQHLVLSMG